LVYTLARSGETLVVQLVAEVHLTTDLSPLYDVVRTHIASRQTAFELRLPPGSFLYSHQIAVLLKCAERVRDAEGTFAIADAPQELREALAWIDPGRLIRLVERGRAVLQPQ
jgi:hypothetical protein